MILDNGTEDKRNQIVPFGLLYRMVTRALEQRIEFSFFHNRPRIQDLSMFDVTWQIVTSDE